MMNLLRLLFFITLGVMLLTACQNADNSKFSTWQRYGGSADQSKYIIQDQITKENVSQLEVAWSYPTDDGKAYQFNPIIIDSVMYVLAKDNSLVALNASTGKEIWIHTNLNGISSRGLAYWENAERTDRRILFTLRNSLQAIDATTGKSILSFGNDGAVDLRQNLGVDPEKIGKIASNTPGAVYKDIIILGSHPGGEDSYVSPPGHIRAYNVITGNFEWRFNTIPQPGEYGYDTWPADAYKYIGGVNCWGEITIDEKSGVAYIPLGSPTYDWYGADRHGTNLFGDCLVALDAKTGKRIWHYQTVHHDLWDYDLAAAPQLIRVKHQGKIIDAVAIATKQGFMFAFDRTSGTPLWPIEERPVPASDMAEEKSWPTQPFPTVLPPFSRQTVTEDDVSPIFLNEDEFMEWRDRLAKAKKGLFVPPSMEETIAIPGAVGGANWGNTASNPERGLVYVLSQNYPSFYKLETEPFSIRPIFRALFKALEAPVKGKKSYETFCQTCHGKELSGADAPSLLGAGANLNIASLRKIVLQGFGRMPPVKHISEEEISTIAAYMREATTVKTAGQNADSIKVTSLVVATGGAPGEFATRSNIEFNIRGDDYPDGVKVPANRYYTAFYGLGYPFILNPPWSIITAYDMNTGQIQWSKPLGGEVPQAVKKGFTKTGVPNGSQRNGMIVTSNGLLFATVTNGKIYAYDASNGEVLWTGQTSLGIASIPSMYQINGRVFIVVNATTPQLDGFNLHEEENGAIPKNTNKSGGYYSFALPTLQ